jgi:hypothetical protein
MEIRTKANLRSLKDIRTNSGRVDRVIVPYMAYMKISCLEMEKTRREKEKASAQSRIRNIDKRLEEIEGEKDAALKNLGERNTGSDQRQTKVREISKQMPGKNAQGFKIRY